MQEAEIRRESRLESIIRANNLLYEDTDRMKYLRSQMLYSDVIHDRKKQIVDKASAQDDEKSYEAFHHNSVLEQVKAGDLADRAKTAHAEDRAKALNIARRAQLDDVVARREQEAKERVMIGAAMKEKGRLMLLEEAQQRDLKQQRANENKAQVIGANEKLKILRLQRLAEEKIAEGMRTIEMGLVDDRKNALKAIGQMHADRAQMKRQSIIDAAAKNLTEKTNNDREILYKQENEVKEREESAALLKERKRIKDWEKIVSGRNEQLAYREEHTNAYWDEECRLAQLLISANEAGKEEDKSRARQGRERSKQIKSLQLEDSIAAQRLKIDMRLLEIESDKILQNAESEVDAKFVKACKEEIKRYTEDGKPLHPLLVALHHKQPDIIPGRIIKSSMSKGSS